VTKGHTMLHDKPNKKLLEELNDLVYGHEEAKKSLITLVNRSKLRHFQKWGELLPTEQLIKPSKCLLIGGSGTGKTHLVQSLARIANFPLLIVDASAFNPTGASGGIKPETLKRMVAIKAKEYSEVRQGTYFSIDGIMDQLVVFVDEFDKISSHYNGSDGNWNEHVQTHFLTLFENSEDLAGVSWIFAGAFSGIDKQSSGGHGRSIGFNATYDESKPSQELSDEDIIKYGMIPEIVGRLTSICRLDKLTEDDFYSILIDKVIPKKLLELSYFNITDINITDDQLRKIAQGALTSSQGVRYLYREIDKHFLDIEFSYEDTKFDV
jgi:ATP-dependent Clp protease ATP-binding subunit ClpX